MSIKDMAKITIYSKDPCPYCDAAKNLLESLEIPFDEIDLTEKLDEMDRIKQETGWRTMPVILINGKLVGGYMDLKALNDEGKLESMLK